METAKDAYEISGKIIAGEDALEYKMVLERNSLRQVYDAKWSLVNTRTGFELSGKLSAGSCENIRQLIQRLMLMGNFVDLIKFSAWFK